MDLLASASPALSSQPRLGPAPALTPTQLEGLGLIHSQVPPPVPESSSPPDLHAASSSLPIAPPEVLPTLLQLHHTHNQTDLLRDTASLRALMRRVFQRSSDVEMIGVLQVGRQEMPEAIKTMQRAL